MSFQQNAHQEDSLNEAVIYAGKRASQKGGGDSSDDFDINGDDSSDGDVDEHASETTSAQNSPLKTNLTARILERTNMNLSAVLEEPCSHLSSG